MPISISRNHVIAPHAGAPPQTLPYWMGPWPEMRLDPDHGSPHCQHPFGRADPVALDAVAARVMGFSPVYPLPEDGDEMGWARHPDRIELVGDDIGDMNLGFGAKELCHWGTDAAPGACGF